MLPMALGVLFSLFSLARGDAPVPAPAPQYSYGCRIFDQNARVVRQYPGMLCVFFDNGDLITGSTFDVVYYDHEMTVKWRREGHFHHFMELTRDGRTLYILGSAKHAVRAGSRSALVRFDVIHKIDTRTGKILKTWDSFHDLKKLSPLVGRKYPPDLSEFLPMGTPPPSADPRARDPHPPTMEYLHMNSINEVQPNALGFFKPGQLVVNAHPSGTVLTFDADLNLLSSVRIKPANIGTHSASVNRAGNLLAYINGPMDTREPQVSSCLEFNPKEGKVVWEFKGAEGQGPYWGPIAGFIGELPDDHFLFSTFTEAFEVDRKGHVYWHSVPPKDQPWNTMPLLKRDFGPFLKANHG